MRVILRDGPVTLYHGKLFGVPATIARRGNLFTVYGGRAPRPLFHCLPSMTIAAMTRWEAPLQMEAQRHADRPADQ